MKNKALTVILIIALFIPTVVSVVYYSAHSGDTAAAENAQSIVINDINNTTYVLDRADGVAEDLINFFYTMNSASLEVAALPAPLVSAKYYKVTMTGEKTTRSYKYYFSLNTAEAYYQDEESKVYKIREADAEKFINGPYGVCLYDGCTFPTFTVSTGALASYAAQWNFKNSKGEYSAANVLPFISTAAQSCIIEGGLGISFSLQPDNIQVGVTDKSTGEKIFNNIYDNIASLSLKEGMQLTFDIKASWYKNDTRGCYGEAAYSFDATVAAPAAFYMKEATVNAGEFFTISGENAANPTGITFTSEPSLDYTPTFFKDGNFVRALVPVKLGTAAGEYKITVSYGGSTQTMTLTVKAAEVKNNVTDSTSATIVGLYRSEAALTEFNTAAKEIASYASEKTYWDGAFDTGCVYDTLAGYGRTFKITATGDTFVHDGVDYYAKTGTDVTAICGGEVIYVGNFQYSGSIVVVEHGYGLKSWYAHLDETSVAKGDIITKGTKIGTCGESGYSRYPGVHISLTVFDVPVSPYPLWSDGDWKQMPFYNFEHLNNAG